MVCSACGAPVAAGVKFCAKCGAAVAAAPFQGQEQPVYASPPAPVAGHYGAPYMPRPRVQRNLQTMAILWFAYAGYRVLAGVIGMFFLRAFVGRGFGAPGWPFNHGFNDDGPHWMAALMAGDYGIHGDFGRAGDLRWMEPAESQAVGTDAGDYCSSAGSAEVSAGDGAGDLYAVGAGSGESGMEWEAIADRS